MGKKDNKDQSNSVFSGTFASCGGNGGCSDWEFCAIRCFTGSCGNDGNVEHADGQFCQPCQMCTKKRFGTNGNCKKRCKQVANAAHQASSQEGMAEQEQYSANEPFTDTSVACSLLGGLAATTVAGWLLF